MGSAQSLFSCPQITTRAEPCPGAAAADPSAGAGGNGGGSGTFRASSLVGQCITHQMTYDTKAPGASLFRVLGGVGGRIKLDRAGAPRFEPGVELTAFDCPDSQWIKGVCTHGTTRWVKMPCKRRTCPVCGQLRKQLIAHRIAHGVEVLGGKDGGGWVVLTFAWDIPKCKAVKLANQFVAWVKLYCRRHFDFKPELAKVWELMANGRLHINMVFAPWHYIPKSVLQEKWQDYGGGVLWVKRVGAEIGVEAAKSRQRIGNYLAKLDQMVPYGRGVSYSKGWPELPRASALPRKGEVHWSFVHARSVEGIMHWYDTGLGHWKEVAPGEWASSEPEPCDCFELRVSPASRARGLARYFMKLVGDG